MPHIEGAPRSVHQAVECPHNSTGDVEDDFNLASLETIFMAEHVVPRGCLLLIAVLGCLAILGLILFYFGFFGMLAEGFRGTPVNR